MILGAWVAVAACLGGPEDKGGFDAAALEKQGFVRLFDGKSLTGWKVNENPAAWKVLPGGILQCHGERSHIFTERKFSDVEFVAEVRTEPKANSGMYFRAEFMTGWPNGYEAQVNNTHGDPVKTGSLYNRVKLFSSEARDGQWWVQHIIAKGNRIIIKVNGKQVVDFVDSANSFTSGHLALQCHDPDSVVSYRNLFAKDLAAK